MKKQYKTCLTKEEVIKYYKTAKNIKDQIAGAWCGKSHTHSALNGCYDPFSGIEDDNLIIFKLCESLLNILIKKGDEVKNIFRDGWIAGRTAYSKEDADEFKISETTFDEDWEDYKNNKKIKNLL